MRRGPVAVCAVASLFIASLAVAGIQLSAFSGTSVPGGVRLDWTTLTETNNFGFNLQRSLNDESNYQTVPNSFVAGAGTSGVPHQYTYTDTSAPGGTWFYRIQQIDLSGPIHYTYGIPAHRPFFAQYLSDSLTSLLLHLDETSGTIAFDMGPYRTNGTITGASSVSGRFGSARAFSAPSHAIRVADTVSLRMSTVTVEAWVTSASFTGMNGGVAVTKRRAGGAGSYSLRMSGTSGRICFATAAGGYDSVLSTTVLQNGLWYHVAGVYDGSGIALYLNGVLEAAHPLAGAIPYDGSALFIGQDSAGTDRWMGSLDEVRLSAAARQPEEFNLRLPPVNPSAAIAGNGVQLTWGDGGGGTGLLRYRILRGADSSTVAVVDSTRFTSFLDAAPPADSTLFYRITAVDSTGFEGRPSAAVMVPPPPQTPVLMFPLNGASGVLPPVTLQWRRAVGADTYRVQLSGDSLFAAPLLDDSTVVDTTVQVAALAGPARYYWRVSARGTGGYSVASAVRRFDVAGAPGVVTLAAPAPGAIIPALAVVLQWHPVAPPVNGYRIEVAHDSLFTATLVDSVVIDTSFALGGLAHGFTYWWRVRALNPQGTGPVSAARSFSTEFTLQIPLAAGWNMLSLPVETPYDSLAEVYPTTISSSAFTFVPLQGYVQRWRLDVGTGYWAKFPGIAVQDVAGEPVTLDSIVVAAGWNMIGSISVPVDTSAIVTVPPGLRISSYFGYAGGFSPVTSLEPGGAYWVKSAGAGIFIVSGGAPAGRRTGRNE